MIENFILERRVDESLAARLRALDSSSRALVEQILERGRPSVSRVRELLTFAEEIAARDRSTLNDVLGFHWSAANEQNSRGENSRELLERFIQSLNDARFPLQAKLRLRLDECVSVIRQDVGLTVQYPRDLEGERFEISVDVRDDAEAKKRAQQFSQLAEHPRFLELIRILRGEFSELV